VLSNRRPHVHGGGFELQLLSSDLKPWECNVSESFQH